MNRSPGTDLVRILLANLLGAKLQIKNRLKRITRSILARFKVSIIFHGERSEKGLFPYFIEFFLSQGQGVLHVGAHHGQESSYYSLMGKPVLWIEADPSAFQILSKNISGASNQSAINALVSDSRRTISFHITSNAGMSSSIHPLTPYGKECFAIENSHSIQLESSTINDLYPKLGANYDFWVIDVQGHEFEVLSGSNLVVNKARWILVEGSKKSYYEDMSLFPKVKGLLESLGFVQVYCPSGDHFEAFFINSNS